MESQSHDSGYKRLTDQQKGALMGFCNETSWADVTPIWKATELTKKGRLSDNIFGIH